MARQAQTVEVTIEMLVEWDDVRDVYHAHPTTAECERPVAQQAIDLAIDNGNWEVGYDG